MVYRYIETVFWWFWKLREGPVELEACGIAMNLSYLWNALTNEFSETFRLRVMGPILKELTEPYP